MTLVVFIIAALLVVAVIMFHEQLSELMNKGLPTGRGQSQKPMTKSEMELRLNLLSKEVGILKRENTELNQQVEQLLSVNRLDREACDKQLERLHNEIIALSDRHERCLEETARNIETLRCMIPPQPQPLVATELIYPLKRYSRYFDQSFNGFRNDELSEINENSIFEIIINSESDAVFHLVPDKSIRNQLFPMLNHVVKPICDITIESQSPEGIEDISYGTLEKNGDYWIIKTKASIKLV